MDFSGKTAIVTGAGVGIGEATALAFARNGANVVVNSITQSGQRTTDAILAEGGSAVFARGDVSVAADAQAITDCAIERFGRIDILVNNAGIVVPGTIDTLTQDQFDRSYEVNVRGVYLMCQNVVKYMRRQGGGSIVNNASVAAIKAVRNRIAYAASKGAVAAMSRCLALDLASERIRVNCVAPGMTLTPSLAQRIADSEDPVQTEINFKSLIPLNRFAGTDEIAKAILFLASDDADFITGAMLSVDGGKSA